MNKEIEDQIEYEGDLLKGILEGLAALTTKQREQFHDRLWKTVENEEEKLKKRLLKQKRASKTALMKVKRLTNKIEGNTSSVILMRCALDPKKTHRRFMTSEPLILDNKDFLEKTLGITVLNYAEEMGFDTEYKRPDYIG